MKRLLLLSSALFLSLAATVEARTWTSSDGARTFEGTLHAYDAESGEVTVIRPNGLSMKFSRDLLAGEDIEFLNSWEGAESGPNAAAGEQSKVHQQIAGTRLHRFDGSRYQRVELDKKPEYFILYFSASW